MDLQLPQSSSINITSFSTHPKILLIEDNRIIQKIHLDFLTMLDCEVDIATTGAQAISMSKNNYDIILLDIGLPDVNGIEVGKTIRALHPNIPIIGITAYGDIIENECLAAGINEIATKPIRREQFYNLLSKYL